ncbi:uncharacterized protein TNCV_4771601 [Trichonephila clavipes]|nr:uncharacterized protein TNCV_4771601 [Trichonephila clavipes]
MMKAKLTLGNLFPFVQNVWKKIYTHGVKTNFAKRLEISGIEVYSGHFTSSIQDTIDAVLGISFPREPNSQDNSQHRVLRSEAELVYESDDDDDVPFSRIEIDCVIDNLSLNKSPGTDRKYSSHTLTPLFGKVLGKTLHYYRLKHYLRKSSLF